MPIIFSNSFRDMAYQHYLKQPRPMCESMLNQLSAKNPRPIYRLKRFLSNPYTREYK